MMITQKSKDQKMQMQKYLKYGSLEDYILKYYSASKIDKSVAEKCIKDI